MQLRDLGSTGLRVSPLWMGTSALGWTTDRHGYPVPRDEAFATVRRVLASPINCIDTSNNYGDGEVERRIGHVIREVGIPSGSLIVTKVDRHPSTDDFSESQVRRSLQQSQERLGMDRFPLLFLHDPEHISLEAGTARGGPLEAMVRLREEGVAAHIGVAGGPIDVLAAYLETGAFEVVITHNRYTLLDRSAERLLQLAERLGVAVVNAAAFGGGILAGRVPRAAQYAYVAASKAVLESAAAMREACADHGVPLAAAAIQFSMREPRITATIVGMSSVEHVDAALEFAAWPIPDELWPVLEGLAPDPAHAIDVVRVGGHG
jgi:D-threo-aldose 1-dehydrogenase